MTAKRLTSAITTCALLWAGVAQAQTPDDAAARPTILLEADSTELGKRGVGLDKVVLDRLGPALDAEGIDVAGTVEDLGVRVRILPVDMDALHYSIVFEIERDDQYSQVLGAVDCKPCIDATLLAKIDARAPALADLIKERVLDGDRAEAAGDSGEGEGGEDDGGGGNGDVEPEPQTEPQIKPIGALGYAGIGTATLGLGATIAGAVELSRGRIYNPEISAQADYELSGRDHRPPGYALIGVGAAVVGAGLVMLGVDVGRRAKQRKPRDQRALIVPIMSPAGGGVGMVGRF